VEAFGAVQAVALLGLHVGLEALVMLKLTVDSSGAWFNYAIPGSISACVLIAVWLDAALAARRGVVAALTLVGASLLLAVTDARLVQLGLRLEETSGQAWNELAGEAAFLRHVPDRRYFSGALAHYNRQAGRARLVHDEWLYRAFEAVGAAEPRTDWLGRELASGSVDLVVVSVPPGEPVPTHVPGVAAGLPELGFACVGTTSHFGLWERRPAAARIAAVRRQRP
jgi:hypothetical protein